MNNRLWAGVAGSALLLMFFGLDETSVGLQVRFAAPWSDSSAQELYVSLGTLLLGLPAFVLLSLAAPDSFRNKISALWVKLEALKQHEAKAIVFGVFTAALLLAASGNALVFEGLPFTDDEYGVQFGGQILASGHVLTKIPPYIEALPTLFLWAHEGMYTSFDFLGAQVPWAFSELTHTGTFVFSLFGAIAAASVAGIVGRKLSPAWGILAALIFLVAPMTATLSMSSHTHVISRGLLAAALLAWVVAEERRTVWSWALVGLLAGSAAATRPPEIILLMGPVTGGVLYDAIKKRQGARVALTGLVLGALLPVGAFVAHAFAVNGTPLPTRMISNEFIITPRPGSHGLVAFLRQPELLWERFGANLSYNVFMLMMWLLGPLTLPLVALGSRRSRFATLLVWGVGLEILFALFHDNYGLHMVGPIHYSDAAIAILVVSTLGLERLYRWIKDNATPATKWFGPVMAGYILMLTLATALYCAGLHRQALMQSTIYGLLDEPRFEHSLVFAPPYSEVWYRHPFGRWAGGFVFSWRRVRPDALERAVVVHNNVSGATRRALEVRFGDRQWFEMLNVAEPPYIVVRPVAKPSARSGPHR